MVLEVLKIFASKKVWEHATCIINLPTSKKYFHLDIQVLFNLKNLDFEANFPALL